MLVDCNVHWPQKGYSSTPSAQDIVQLKNTVVTLEELGYTHIVLNFTLNHKDKIPQGNSVNPINLELLGDLRQRIKFFTRVTIIIEEPSQGQSISKLQNNFDIISVLPVTEKALILACNNLDIDLITFDYTKRLPTFLKHKTVGAAVKRGIKLEITYSNFLDDSNRTQFINNSLNVIRASRNQGLILSSGALAAVQCRSFHDVLNLMQLLGFKQSNETLLAERASNVLLNGRLRLKSYKQTVVIGEDPVEESVGAKRNIGTVDGGSVFKEHLKKLKK